MKKILKAIFLFALLLHSYPLAAQGYLRAEGEKIVNDKGEVLLRGMGLGGWILQEPYMLNLSGVLKTQQELKDSITSLVGENRMNEFYDAWHKNGIQKADVDSLAAWGFNSLRIPMHYNLYTLPVEKEPVPGENTWIEKGFTLTDSLLKWCKANKIYLMLDLHAAPGGQGNDIAISDASQVKLWESEANKKKMIAFWKKLAERYVDEEWIGAYDIINEPNYGFQNPEDKNGLNEKGNAPLRQLMVDITQAIREVDKKHLIVISGNGWGNNYNGIFPLWDNNTAISFHKYWNYNDPASIGQALENRKKNKAPLWMSESGENSNVWFTDAIRLFEENNIGWCWWTYKKMGLACPMEIRSCQAWDDLLAYWAGKGKRPSSEEAYKALMELADNYKIENTIFHHEQIDAMFRQVSTDATKPFVKLEVKKNKRLLIFAGEYDLGRNSYAYHDKDSANYRVSDSKSTGGNQGHRFRNDAVDLIPCSDGTTNTSCVAYTEAGEWLQYTLNVATEGIYQVNLRTAMKSGEGNLHFSVNGTSTKNIIRIPETGGDQVWQTIPAGKISLKKGINKLRIYIDKGGFNLNWIDLSPSFI